ncbi:S8 family serine peptidase [uncultured Sunxiuqinia sp.]|uniref:S8 family serine peptidase n=1 Tax=uncultured Sunxiuqinia sp. TaxID=1573825 RepID=UPI002AA8C4DD|nr:S8 family serine peptidase [uncultured Sunxiuqinia sp.]
MLKSWFFIASLIILTGNLVAQDEVENFYWVRFKDKLGTVFSINQPEQFLSLRAIERRQKQNIAVDELDLPVSINYLQQLKEQGAEIIHTSKWLNGATIRATTSVYEQIRQDLNFIAFSELTKPGIFLKSARNKFQTERQLNDINISEYGSSYHQLRLFNGQLLHALGYRGEGMHIAVLDAGFYKVDELPAFEQLWGENRILGTKDFVDPGGDVFLAHTHGTNVLSTMGGYVKNKLIGTAPEASYYLLRSEDGATEYPTEEDNWVAAAEWADSAGCDVINSSLGYTTFDDADMNHSYAEMDGNTTRITKAANIAVEKGMLVFSSAGNEANNPWRYLVAPSDGNLVIGVAAVNNDSIWAPFSSLGPSADGDVKPNLAAVGWGTILQKTDGRIGPSNGTSFASPILAGMAACLWQAHPDATNLEIKEALEKSASQYAYPNDTLGYGIPNFHLANLSLRPTDQHTKTDKWTALPNPFSEGIYLFQTTPKPTGEITISLFSALGNCLYKQVFQYVSSIFIPNLANLPAGLILLKIETNTDNTVIKLIKVN